MLGRRVQYTSAAGMSLVKIAREKDEDAEWKDHVKRIRFAQMSQFFSFFEDFSKIFNSFLPKWKYHIIGSDWIKNEMITDVCRSDWQKDRHFSQFWKISSKSAIFCYQIERSRQWTALDAEWKIIHEHSFFMKKLVFILEILFFAHNFFNTCPRAF